MTTRRTRRVSAPPAPMEDERRYTEEDYAAPEPEGLSREEVAYAGQMAWLPDQFEAPAPDADAQDWAEEPEEDYVPIQMEGYDPLYQSETDYTDAGEPFDEDYLTEEEQEELRRSHWQLLANLADLAGVILGTIAILVLVTLLVSLLNWLVGDMSQSFILLQKNF